MIQDAALKAREMPPLLPNDGATFGLLCARKEASGGMGHKNFRGVVVVDQVMMIL